MVHVPQPVIGQEHATGRVQLAAQVDVFAGFERRIESADRLEGVAADGEVAAAEPVGILACDERRRSLSYWR